MSDTSNEIEELVIAELPTLIRNRRKFGRDKYKTTMERDDLPTVDWLQHIIEELLDATIYAKKLQRDFKEELYDVDKMNDLVEENQKLKKYENIVSKISSTLNGMSYYDLESEFLQRIKDILSEANKEERPQPSSVN